MSRRSRTDRILDMYRRHWSRRDIATVLGTTYAVVHRTLKQAGLPPQHQQKTTYAKEMKEQARPYLKCPECGHQCQLEKCGLCLECTLLKRKS